MWRLGVDELAANLVGPLLPHLFRRDDGSETWLCTTPLGDWAWLDPGELTEFLLGTPSDALRERLAEAGLVHGELELRAAGARLARHMEFLNHGPQHVTLHVSRRGRCASLATVERATDVAFVTTSKKLAVEIVIDGLDDEVRDLTARAVTFARDKNRLAFKELRLVVRTSGLAWRDDVVLRETVTALGVDLRLVLERPTDLEADVTALDADTEALVTSELLTRVDTEELVSRIQAAGFTAAHLAPPGARDRDEAKAWLVRHDAFVDCALAVTPPLMERTTARIAAKILGATIDAPDDPMWRAPAGDGLGTFSVDVDGTVGTSEDALALARSGNPSMILGKIDRLNYHDIVGHEAVVSSLVASIPEGQPACSQCSFMRWCAIRPARNVAEHGSPFGRPADSSGCTISTGIVRSIFSRLAEGHDFAAWNLP